MALHDDGANYINHVDGWYSNGGATNNNVIYAAVLRHSLLTWMGQSRKSGRYQRSFISMYVYLDQNLTL
jgi:hypothetical protein